MRFRKRAIQRLINLAHTTTMNNLERLPNYAAETQWSPTCGYCACGYAARIIPEPRVWRATASLVARSLQAFAGTEVPFLTCFDLALFKTFFYPRERLGGP